jgi:hypothetical protein
MSSMTRVAAGAAVGLALAAAVFAAGRWRSGAFVSASCPQGWQLAEGPSATGQRLLRACVSRAEGMDGARIELLWSPTGALDDGQLSDAAKRAGFATGQELRAQHDADGAAMVREHQGVALKSDVYFLSAGQRYGLLSIVYGPAATFINEDTVAGWMETVEGTATWGAPVNPELRARCPEGFSTLRASGPGLIVRCMRHVGTSAFTVLQLLQSNGGFGSEADRARLAGDIAQRVASGGGGRARVLVQPTPFTRARNVDAMRASFETDERLTLNTRVAWVRGAQSGNVIAHYVGPDNDEGPTAASAMVRSIHGTRVTNGAVLGASAALLALGVALGALLGRAKAKSA